MDDGDEKHELECESVRPPNNQWGLSVSHRVWKVIIYLFQYCYLETPPPKKKSLDFYMNTMSDATYHLSQNIKIVPEI